MKKFINIVQEIKNMYQAIMENDVTTLQCLAYNGLLDVHRDNNYPIRFACCNGNTEAATFLLQHGADPSSDNNSPIRFSSVKGHEAVVRLLLDQEDERINPCVALEYTIQEKIRNVLMNDPRCRFHHLRHNVEELEQYIESEFHYSTKYNTAIQLLDPTRQVLARNKSYIALAAAYPKRLPLDTIVPVHSSVPIGTHRTLGDSRFETLLQTPVEQMIRHYTSIVHV